MNANKYNTDLPDDDFKFKVRRAKSEVRKKKSFITSLFALRSSYFALGNARLLGALLFGLACAIAVLADNCATAVAQEKDKKEKEKSPLEGKKGVAIGTLTEKGPNFIELKADGEEKGRRYVPQWVGGAPDKGGGPDKKMVKIFSELKVGSRLEVEWLFEERLRALSVKVLKK